MVAMMIEDTVETVEEAQCVPHPTLVKLCQIFTARIHGEAAGEILASGTIPEALVVLPLFDFQASLIKVGRKELGHSRIGMDATQKLSMPVRRVYCADEVLWTAATGTVSYRAEGMGHLYAGNLTIGRLEGYHDLVPVTGAVAVERELKALVAASNAAFWDWQVFVEEPLRKKLRKAHAAAANEHGRTRVIDEVTFEQVFDRMTLGFEDERGAQRDGAVQRLLKRCCKADAFLRVDPLKFINVDLDREAKMEIRLAIGDTRLGPKIRAVARELGDTTDTAMIVAAYKLKYPGDYIATDRVTDAMSVRPETIPTWVPLEDLQL